LVLFRSLAEIRPCVSGQLRSLAPDVASYFDGVEVCLSQLNPSVLDACAEEGLRVICRLEVVATSSPEADAAEKLGALSDVLLESGDDPSRSLVTVVMTVPLSRTGNARDAGGYLYRVLPLAAEFLERHPWVGGSHGVLNAHGRPLNNHVLGVCQSLRRRGCDGDRGVAVAAATDVDFLADVVDLLPPTNLSLDARDFSSVEDNELLGGDSFASVLHHTEHVTVDGPDQMPRILERLWGAKARLGARETYATVAVGSGGRSDRSPEELAAELRRRYDTWLQAAPP